MTAAIILKVTSPLAEKTLSALSMGLVIIRQPGGSRI